MSWDTNNSRSQWITDNWIKLIENVKINRSETLVVATAVIRLIIKPLKLIALVHFKNIVADWFRCFPLQDKAQLILLVGIVIVVQSSIMIVSCRPSDRGEHHYKLQEDEEEEALTPLEIAGIKKCEADENQMELCARCTKATKARNVYPMCCLNEDGVGDWCRDFVYFGIQ